MHVCGALNECLMGVTLSAIHNNADIGRNIHVESIHPLSFSGIAMNSRVRNKPFSCVSDRSLTDRLCNIQTSNHRKSI